MALDALLDVMTTVIDEDRLEKEVGTLSSFPYWSELPRWHLCRGQLYFRRPAWLTRWNTESSARFCRLFIGMFPIPPIRALIVISLLATHRENRISSRFPIGKEHLIKSWTRADLQLYHKTHYRPDNVILFVVGDVDISTTGWKYSCILSYCTHTNCLYDVVDTIKQKFGSLAPQIDAAKVLKDSGEFPEQSMRSVNRHFPPVIHRYVHAYLLSRTSNSWVLM